jgi:hypothetical protein
VFVSGVVGIPPAVDVPPVGGTDDGEGLPERPLLDEHAPSPATMTATTARRNARCIGPVYQRDTERNVKAGRRSRSRVNPPRA